MITEAPRLVIVEGLTGSGKSTLAHSIARQMRYNSLEADWLHEAELDHPLSLDLASLGVVAYQQEALARWRALVENLEIGGGRLVVEACLFNNLFESLLAHNQEQAAIVDYALVLQEVIRPLDPVLIYLVSGELSGALARNFQNRGERFERFVIEYAVRTPYARRRGLAGYEGMLAFWDAFVALTDEIFGRYSIRKLALDVSAPEWGDADWGAAERQAMHYLSLPLIPDPALTTQQAAVYIGAYRDRDSGRVFEVGYDAGCLWARLHSQARSRLVPCNANLPYAANLFCAAGWHFELLFEPDGAGRAVTLHIGGRDVDYLRLAGTRATRL